MLTSLIEAAGPWFVIACVAQFVAVFAEQAGAARTPQEDDKRDGFSALLRLTTSLLTPGLLLAHGFLTTRGGEQTLHLIALAAPVAAMLGGALFAAMFGAMTRGAGGAMRMASLPLGIAAFLLTLLATFPSIRVLIEAAQNNWTIVTP